MKLAVTTRDRLLAILETHTDEFKTDYDAMNSGDT